MKTVEVELAVVKLLNPRVHAMVPNVSWGLGLRHECDILALNSGGYFSEIEIKVSVADMKKDLQKRHGHNSKIISRLIYAFPLQILEKVLPLVPERCGIIVVDYNWRKQPEARWHRVCKYDKTKKPSPAEIEKFYQLGLMRIWSLKNHLNEKRNSKSNIGTDK